MSKTAHDPSDSYLRKRDTREGVRRRCLTTRDELFAALSDRELDDRNARVWASVQHTIQVATGLEPLASPDLRSSDLTGARYRIAERCALRLCRDRYGIPVARLAEISGHSRPWVSRQCAAQDVDSLASERAWLDYGGPAIVDSRAELAAISVTSEARDALAVLCRGGLDPVVVVSELLLCAASGSHSGSWSDLDVERLRRLARLGLPDSAIGPILGRSQKSVTRMRERLRIAKGSRGA